MKGSNWFRSFQAVLLILTLLLPVLGQPGQTAAAAAGQPASMEAIHASYLDLATNIADLRSRVDLWSKGDESSLNIAGEKLDRTQAILTSVSWPPAMATAIGKAHAAAPAMAAALKAKDATAAAAAAKTLGDASHDVTHAFYGEWLPSLKGQQFSTMAPHATYLDLSTNIADLRSRVDAWQNGDESSLNIAKEKLDRIAVLVPHLAGTGVLIKPVQAINAALPAVGAALTAKDAAAAQAAIKPIADASHDLTHGFYEWMGVTAGASDPACVRAGYQDLSANIADLRSRLDAWAKGDDSSLNIAGEKMDRISAILSHVSWPKQLTTSVGKAATALPALAQAIKGKDKSMLDMLVKPLADASHDVTHAYYGEWLPTADTSMGQAAASGGMPGMNMPQAAPAMPAMAPVSAESLPHGHGGEAMAVVSMGTKPLVLGAFGLVNAVVIATAAVLKVRKAKTAAAPTLVPGSVRPAGNASTTSAEDLAQ